MPRERDGGWVARMRRTQQEIAMTATTRQDRVGAEYAWVPAGAGLAGC